MFPMNSKPTRKPAFLQRLLTVRPLWAVVVATATLISATLTAQIRPLPDITPVPPTPQVEPPPERPVPPTPPAEPQTPAEPEGPPIRPEGESRDDTGGQSGGQAPTLANDIFLEAGSDEAYVSDASATETIARVETELRTVLKISATEPGLRVRVQKGNFRGDTCGLWRYVSADNIQLWARWILSTNTSSGLKLFVQTHYTGPYSGDSAEFFNPANYAISEESRLYVQDVNLHGQIASWTPPLPVNFWTLLTREVPGGSTFTVDSLRAEFASLSNLSVNGDTFGGQYFTVSADLTTSPEFPGLQPILDVQRTLRRISREGVRQIAAVPGPMRPVEPATPAEPERPTVRPEPTGDTTTPVQPETPPVQSAPGDSGALQGLSLQLDSPRQVEPPPVTAKNPAEPTGDTTPQVQPETPPVRSAPGDGGVLQGLSLQLDYPELEIAEDRLIPLYFTILGTFPGSMDLTVRARFVSGTATPGLDFDMSQPVRVVPSVGGMYSMNWLPISPIRDEVNEGDETAVFELSIDGSTNPPVSIKVTILDDMNPGQVGFVSPRFQINEGSTNGYAQIRLWRTLNTREAATVAFRLEGPAAALAVLGGQTRRTANFQPGESQIFVQIPLVNDTEAQGTRDVTLTLEPAEGGLELMKGFESTVLTLADDETPGVGGSLAISEYESQDGRRGVSLTTTVPRGYQVRLESSDTGALGPWRPCWIFEGADVERVAFDSFDASVMRMYRILPPEPVDYTYPW